MFVGLILVLQHQKLRFFHGAVKRTISQKQKFPIVCPKIPNMNSLTFPQIPNHGLRQGDHR